MLTVGVDVGGTSIKSALISVEEGRYTILQSFSTPTQGDKGAEIIVGNIVKAIKHFDLSKVDKIGVATAGTVDWDSGIVTYATDALMGFTGLRLSEVLTKKLGTKVTVVNDAVGALVAECFCGAGVGYERVMMLTLGTGLGAGLLVDRRLDEGSVVDTRLGHYALYPNGDRVCFCGKRGCAECYVSATGLKKSAATGDLREVFSNKSGKYTKALKGFFEDFTKIVKIASEQYHPDLILVGGGVMELGDLWWKRWSEPCERQISAKLRRATLGNAAGVTGAVYCALNGVFQRQ
ncbi:MAG: ROK family protein [Eubacteriales bacterium]|nr:ROK family protein [Eubacteriales bacterium]